MKALLESVKKTPKGYFYANELPRHIDLLRKPQEHAENGQR
jgi:hypothetical protein